MNIVVLAGGLSTERDVSFKIMRKVFIIIRCIRKWKYGAEMWRCLPLIRMKWLSRNL